MENLRAKRRLGTTDIEITPLVFGAWAIGGWMWGGTDENEAVEAIRGALDHGITTIDTAPSYGFGLSEEIVGKAIAGRRDQLVLATKCGIRWNSEEGTEPSPQTLLDGTPVTMRKNSRPDSIVYECEQSLKRLKTDVIDIYQIHWPDVSTPIEDSMAALETLRQQGKIRAIGVSNFDRALLARACAVAKVDSNQPPYSVLSRAVEGDTLPYCREHNIGVICYSPMERGLLTGAVTPERRFAPGDHRAKHKYFTTENRRRVLDALEQIRPIAEAHKATFSQVIINWTIQADGITGAIVGARNREQAVSNAKALDFRLSAEECSVIRKIFEPIADLG